MFSKLNYKILVVLLIVLGGIYAITTVVQNRKGERTFRAQLVEINAEDVTSIVYYPDPVNGTEIKLIKSPDGWKVHNAEGTFNADGNAVNSLVSTLSALKPERVAATDESGWGTYQVDDSTGIRVMLYEDSKVLSDLVIGKFSYKPQQSQNPYQQQQGKMTSYVRLNDEKEVYAVDGFLKMSFQNDVKAYRDRSLVKTDRDRIARVSCNAPDGSSFTLSKQGDKYMVDGIIADSAKTVKYLNNIAVLSGSDFINNASVDFNNPDGKLTIDADNSPSIEVLAFASGADGYIITSSANPGTYFDGSKSGLFEKIFVTRESFLP